MVMAPADKDRAPRSVINLTQIHTFLRLVEEGSIARASARLGLGHSTVSAHSKLISEDLGQSQFSRVQGGLVVTPAGLEAYGRFRAIMARSVFCLRYFRTADLPPVRFAPVRMPPGFPGSLLDIALDRVTAATAAAAPELCLLPRYGDLQAGILADSAAAFDYLAWDSEAATHERDRWVRDRWVIIRSGANIGWSHRPVTRASLSGARIHIPKLPQGLHGTLIALSERSDAKLEWSGTGIHELLAGAAQMQSFCAIAPASLLKLPIVAENFECALLEEGDLDPAVSVAASDLRSVADALREELRRLLDPASFADRATASPEIEAEPETLSLKHCRSFLALYEEGNVRRAAQRLSVVQPALTVQLHRIEEQAGCGLFIRSYHGLRADARADALYNLIGPLIGEFNATLRHLRAIMPKEAAPVRIGLIPALDDESLMAESFAAALDKWSRAYPEGVAQAVEGYSSTLIRWLHSGKVDFALIDRIAPDPGLLFETIAEDSMAVVVGAASGILRPGPVTLDQLIHLPLVLPSSRHGLRTLLAQTLRERGLLLRPRLEMDSMAGCLSLVKIARYATILPMGSVYKSHDRRGLSVHEIVEPRIVRNICLARNREKPCGEAALNLIDELRLAFADAADPLINPLAAIPTPALLLPHAS
jgi:LysR family nitrogen assimilation transcriptional regulator